MPLTLLKFSSVKGFYLLLKIRNMKMYMNIVLFVLFHFEMLYAQQSYLFNKK